MASHDACNSGTCRVLTVPSLQRLKIEALSLATADCDVRSMINILNAQSIAPIDIHRQLCQVNGHTRLDGQHIFCRSLCGMCLIIIHPIAGPHAASVFSEWQRGGDECHGGSNPGRQTSMKLDTKVGPTVWQMSQFRRWICWKIVQHLIYLWQ